MKIEVFGPGCPRCKQTKENLKKVLEEKNIQAEIEHITDLKTISNRGIMMTPAVVIDGVKKAEGRIPTAADILKWLEEQ